MIRVLQNSQIWLGLTETWLYTQITHLPEEIRNFVACYETANLNAFPYEQLHVFSETPAGKLLQPAVQRKRMTRIRFALYNRWIYSIARAVNADILHSHFGPMAWYAHRAAEKARLKHLVTFYGVDVNQVPVQNPRWLDYYGRLFVSIDHVLCEGPYMAGSITGLGCPPEKVLVHHLGIRLDEIPFTVRRWQPGEPLKILIAASFREKKGIPYALEAVGKLARSTPIKVTIIGDANQSEAGQREKSRILKVIADYELGPHVQMRGYRPYAELLRAMQEHHIFLSPSVHAAGGDTEGGAPVSIIEAAASGMLVVSTTHCDIPNVIKHGETGLLAPERDVEALVDHLQWLLQHPEKWAEIAERGRKHIETNFDARKQGLRLGEIYRSLVISA